MLCICIYIHIYIYTYICMYICIYVCVCVCVCVSVCVCVCVCVCMCVCLSVHCYIYYASPTDFLRFERFVSFLSPRSSYVYVLRVEVNSRFFKLLYKKRE